MDLINYSLVALVEALLFAAPEPINLEKLCGFTEETEDELLLALDIINNKYQKEDSGLALIKKGQNYTISTKFILGEKVAKFLQSRRSPYLSQAALEVLSIVAYNQPITKTYISQVRGIPSSELVENLVDKNLLKENGRLDLPGKPMSYITTDKFLTIFGIDSLDELPLPETLVEQKEEIDEGKAEEIDNQFEEQQTLENYEEKVSSI